MDPRRQAPRTTAALMLAFAAACGEEPPRTLTPPPSDAGAGTDAASPIDPAPLAEPRAGSRLRPVFVEGSDGRARRFLHFVDAAADGEPCYLTRFPAADMPVRCFPKASGTTVYTNAACDRPHVETAAIDYTVVFGDVHARLGAPLAAQPSERHPHTGPGQCGMLMPRWGTIYEIDPAMPPELASGRLVEDDSDARLSLRFFEGADGSRALYQITDRLTQASCAPGTTPSGVRCVPEQIGELHDAGLLDERCERLLILEYGSTPVARVPQRNGDVYRFEFSRGEDNTIAVGTRAPDGRCEVSRMPLGRRTAHLGAPYPEADWPPMTAERGGDDALSAQVATVLSDVRAEAETSTERTLRFDADGTPCAPAWSQRRTAELRCLPVPPASFRSWRHIYADSQCTERVLSFDSGASPPAQLAITETGMRKGQHFLPEGSVSLVGAAYVGPIYERVVSTQACRMSLNPGTPEQLFRRGQAVPEELFPELRVTVAP